MRHRRPPLYFLYPSLTMVICFLDIAVLKEEEIVGFLDTDYYGPILEFIAVVSCIYLTVHA